MDIEKHLEKALKFVREHTDREYVNYMVCKSMQMRCRVSHVDALLADTISDLLDEYSNDNDLHEDWWRVEYDIDDIIEKL